ncbi:protein kinase domain-containing protein [Micromonospora cathayae]|uniref:non-specific serine/threonine protein kinase n=1 Tax=Micromonospora cathayae TaxID=3028804 RepID=A0ABY7ZHR5_9ACTN|nr:protein kinase [Micromonospora sp. HUAS 3]WDZ82476.1 protein kinase [Micromonospora sp. HUAS 3]
MSPFTPALRLHDRFVLRERIGRGGMSEVWRADDEVLHRPVAVKALAGQFATDPELRATIQREARAAARLTHPHVTQVYDYGEATLPGGMVVPYLVMELVAGENLADRLTRGPLAWPDAVRSGGQIAAALAAAHRIGVVHRDVKPGNVLLTDTGAKVLDFGIAALAGPPRRSTEGSSREPLMGTPAYLAPERFGAGPPDPASDVYALGAVLYRMITGRAPLPVHSWQDALAVHVRGTPVPPMGVPELPADVERLVLACLAADPTGRPTAAEVAARLGAGAPEHPPTTVLPVLSRADHPPTLVDRSIRGGPPAPERPDRIVADRPDPWTPTAGASVRPSSVGPASRRSNRTVGVLVAVGVALLVGLVGVIALGGSSDEPAAGPATASAGPPATPAQLPPTTRPAPAATRTPPTTLRDLADEVESVISQAERRGTLDGKAAQRLREELAKLESGKPKDRAKRLRELRKRLDEAVEDEQIDETAGTRLLTMLDRFPGGRAEDEPDDED